MMIQIPTDVPNPANNTPVNLNNPFEVILYVIAPILLFVLYLYLRKKSRSNKTTNESDEK